MHYNNCADIQTKKGRKKKRPLDYEEVPNFLQNEFNADLRASKNPHPLFLQRHVPPHLLFLESLALMLYDYLVDFYLLFNEFSILPEKKIVQY